MSKAIVFKIRVVQPGLVFLTTWATSQICPFLGNQTDVYSFQDTHFCQFISKCHLGKYLRCKLRDTTHTMTRTGNLYVWSLTDGCVLCRYIIPVLASRTGREMTWQMTTEQLGCRRASLARQCRVDGVRGGHSGTPLPQSLEREVAGGRGGSTSSETGLFSYFN